MRRINFTVSFFIMLLMSFWLSSQTPQTEADEPSASAASLEKPLPVDPKITIGKLDNGLRFYIRENHKPESRAELRLVVNAGSILEDPDQQGLAHFVEHMAFNGTENFAKQELVDYLESIGMRFGPDINAYTSFDETVYMLQIPTDSSKIVSTAFQILEEWAHRVSFEDEEIDKERGVVIEEWRLRRGAQARILDKQFPILFQGSHYAERLPIGKKEILESFKYETLRRFYHDWYRPDLMAVVAVGDFDKSTIEALIRQHFSGLSMPENPRQRKLYPVPDHSETLFAIASDPEATSSSVSIYYKKDVREEGTEGAYRQTIVQALYHGMFNNRLDELRQQPEPPFLLAFSGEGRFIRTKEFVTLGAVVKDNQIETGLEALLTEAARVDHFGFTHSELDRQKSELLRGMEKAYNERDKTESRLFAAEYIRNFLTEEPLPGIEYEYKLYQKFIPGITLEEVNQLAKDWISEENRVVLVDGPKKEGVTIPDKEELQAVFSAVEAKKISAYEDTVSDEPLITRRLTPGQIVHENLIAEIGVTELTLSNGIRVVLKPTDFQNDQVLFSAFSPGGTSLVPDDQYIAASTASSIINQGGIGKFNQIELEKKLAGKVVQVSPWINALREGLSGSASPRDIETMFQLIHLYFTAPRRDSTAFLSYQSRIKGWLQNRGASPEAAFEDTIAVTMSQHHFRRRPWSEALLAEMDLKKSYDFYRDRFADASDFTFLFVGNIDLQTFRPLLATYLGSLPASNRQETWKDRGIVPPRGIVKKEVHKGLEPKSRVRIVFSGPFEWKRQNRYDINAMTAVLQIKLRETLREDQGGTYSVGVWASPSHYPREEYEIDISFGCEPQRVDELTGLVFQQIDSLRNFPTTEKYLQKVREAQRRKYETDLKKNRYWLDALEQYYINHQNPLDILDFPRFIEHLSADAVRKAAQKYFGLDNYVQVVLFPEQN